LTPLVDGKACLGLTLINKGLRKIILSSGLLLASLAILAPMASGRECGYGVISNGSPDQRTYSDQNTDNCDLVEFSPDNIGGGTLDGNCYGAGSDASPASGGAVASAEEENPDCGLRSPAILGNNPGEDSKIQPSEEKLRVSKPADFNRETYYKNKLEFSLDVGCLPINIPLPFDFFSGDPYATYPLKYTLVPIIGSLRWHMSDIGGPWILRGNWDFQFSGSVTAIPRGPETRYLVYIMGMRRNFVPHNSRTAPYFDVRLGVGNIDAKGPDGVPYAQGQDLTFTFNFGSGVRYNFNSRYAISAGVNYMHISNANLSQHSYDPADKNPWGFINYGINVVGPMVGIDVQLRRHRRDSE
jgi:hypothetical protein